MTDDAVIEAEGATLTHEIKLVDANGDPVNLADTETIKVTIAYAPTVANGIELDEDLTSNPNMVEVTITGDGGSVYTITNTVADDTDNEGSESYTATLFSVSNGTSTFAHINKHDSEIDAIGTIYDEDTIPPEVTVDLEVNPGTELLEGTTNIHPDYDAASNPDIANTVNVTVL